MSMILTGVVSLNRIVRDLARQQGRPLSHVELDAGLTQDVLNRAHKRGDIRISTVVKLLTSLGYRVVIEPNPVDSGD